MFQSPWKLIWVGGVLAFMAGTLFRLAGELDAPPLRMLGFWSLVAICLMAARAIGRLQVNDAWAEVRAGVEKLWPLVEVVRLHGPLAEEGPLLVVVAPAGVLALTADGMANYGAGKGSEKRVAAAEARARKVAALVATALTPAEVAVGSEGAGSWLAGMAPRVHAGLVFLRRRVEVGQGISLPAPGKLAVINPDAIEALADSLRWPERWDADERQAIAAQVASQCGGTILALQAQVL